MLKKKVDILFMLLFLVSFALILLYLYGAFSDVGIFPLHHSQSTAILFGSIALLFVGFCYLSGQLGVLPKTVRSYDGTISRVIKSSQYEKEYIIRGSESEKLQKVLATQWPFEGHSFESQWIAVDSKGNNVTNSKLGLSEGTVEIIFQPR